MLVMNAASGAGDKAAVRAAIEDRLRAAGRRFVVRVAERGDQIPQLAADAVAQAKDERGAVIAAGGDGTLNAVAQAVLPSALPFGALPQGTFNYFARAHGLPLEPDAAAQVWLDGDTREVQVGQVNGQAFLVNASLGVYPRLLQAREEDNRQFGRHRVVAAWAALRTLWRERRTLRLALDIDGRARRVRTPTLFIGNNALQLSQLGLDEADAVQHEGRLAAIVVPPVGLPAMLRLIAKAALGALGEDPAVHSQAFSTLTATPLRRKGQVLQVAYDGELRWLKPPLVFGVAPQRLRLLVPAPVDFADTAPL
jgi:diacylglycerol kinase family enzyme